VAETVDAFERFWITYQSWLVVFKNFHQKIATDAQRFTQVRKHFALTAHNFMVEHEHRMAFLRDQNIDEIFDLPGILKLNAATFLKAVATLEKLIARLISLAVCPVIRQEIASTCDEIYKAYSMSDRISDHANLYDPQTEVEWAKYKISFFVELRREIMK
jgi:hypothetical protein